MINILTATKKDSLESEWDKLDFSYYGKNAPWVYKPYKFKAIDSDSGELLGTIVGKYESGVLYIEEVMVKEAARGKGIGTLLVKKAEDFCKTLGGHKVWLVTGTTWPTNAFYTSLGYKESATIPNFYFGIDMKMYTKDM
jgi:GNAT superfamily N-acetyltransferase